MSTATVVRRSRSSVGKQWRTDIQGLRAVAVGLVVAAHAGMPFFDGGFIGVDVFFVISGYLITGLLLREHDRTGRISIAEFYVRRARRILPAATLVLCVVLVVAALGLPRTTVGQTAGEAGWSAVFLTNWHLAAGGTDYFSSEAPSLLQHYWSLAVEEQFYLVWPLLALLLLPRLSRAAFTRVTLLIAGASLAWSLHLTSASPAAAYFNTPARAYELSAGAVLACLGPGVLRAPYRTVAGALGAALLLVGAVEFQAGSAFPGWHALVPVIATVLLLSAGPACPTGRLLSMRPMRWLGDVSFSLYLWHWPAILIVPALLPEGWPRPYAAVLAVLTAVLLSAASHRWVEQPFQHRRVALLSRGRRPLLLWPLSLAAVLLCAAASTGFSEHQLQARERAAQEWYETSDATGFASGDGVPDVDDELSAALSLADDGAPIPPTVDEERLPEDGWRELADGCYAGDGESSAADCTFGAKDSDRVVALVGDSHAAMWLPAVDRIGREHGFRVELFAKLSCAPYPVHQPAKGMTQEECDAFRDWTQDRLTELRPETILLTARGVLFMEERDGVSVPDQWSGAVDRAIDEFGAVSEDVRVLGDVPTRPDPAECLTAVDASQEGCVSEADGLEADSNSLTRAAAEAHEVPYLDMARYVCLEGRCPLIVDTYGTYEDDSHIAGGWAAHLAPRIAEDLGL